LKDGALFLNLQQKLIIAPLVVGVGLNYKSLPIVQKVYDRSL